MRSGLSAPLALADDDRGGLRVFLRRQAGRAAGAALLAGVTFTLAALGTWNVDDPSFSHATDNPVTNAMGYAGAVISDLAMQFFGLSSVAALVPAVIWGLLLASARGLDDLLKRGAAWFGASLLFAAIAGCLTPPLTWPLPTGLGGVFVEILRDTAFEFAPLDVAGAQRMLRQTRVGAFLAGARGRPQCDIEAAAQALVAIADIGLRSQSEIAALEVNPLIVLAKGRGAIGVDIVVEYHRDSG